MKKITKLLILMAAITLLTALLAISAFAEIITGNCGADGDNVTYKLDTKTGVLEIEGVGNMADYTEIEEEYFGIFSTAPWAHYNYREKIINIVISDGVTSIGNCAFAYCPYVMTLKIPVSITSVGYAAFFVCSNLKELYISDIEAWMKVSLKDDPFSYSYDYLEGGSIYVDGNLLTELIVPEGVTDVDNFFNCDSLTSVTIPDGVKSIGDSAFCNCSNLTSVTIPDSVTSIGYSAFYYCRGLVSVTIPDSVTSIGSWAFSDCSSLQSIEIPDSVTSIADFAFSSCSSLASVTFDSIDLTFGSNVFYNCNKLKTIYLYKNSTADEYFSLDKYTKIYLDAYFMTFEGYQVREDGYNGLRSRFVVDFAAMPTLENGGFEVIEVGAIFVSTDKLAAMGDEFTVYKGGDGAYRTVSYGMTIPVMKNGDTIGKYVSKTEDELVFACTITNFDATNYNKLVSSRGYAVLADADGNEYVVYCDYEMEEYRSVSLEMICDALYGAGQITADNISYSNVAAFRKED